MRVDSIYESLIFFSVSLSEVVLKVYAFGGHRHISPHWDKFDLAITAACAVELAASYSNAAEVRDRFSSIGKRTFGLFEIMALDWLG